MNKLPNKLPFFNYNQPLGEAFLVKIEAIPTPYPPIYKIPKFKPLNFKESLLNSVEKTEVDIYELKNIHGNFSYWFKETKYE
jgi:hypothetical protein